MSWFYRHLLRPALFAQDAEQIHDRTLRALAWASRQELVCDALESFFGAPALPSEVFGLRFLNPVGLAAGMDKYAEALPAWQALGFSFTELGAVTWHAQPGNPPPRLFRAIPDEAIINRMGFNNPGAAALAEKLADWRARGRWPRHPVGINLGKSKITPLAEAAQDYADSFRVLWPHLDFFVVNVSSPNTPNLRQLQDKAALDEILAALGEVHSPQSTVHSRPAVSSLKSQVSSRETVHSPESTGGGQSQVSSRKSQVGDQEDTVHGPQSTVHGPQSTVHSPGPGGAGAAGLSGAEPAGHVPRSSPDVAESGLAAHAAPTPSPKPILVKVAPDLSLEALDEMLELVAPRQIAGIIATNTTITRPQTSDAALQRVYAEAGGLSGRPLRARSTELVRHLYRQTRGSLPIIGVGGIFDAADAWEKITAGASLVQVYTGLVYEGPGIARAIVTGLLERLEQAGLTDLRQAVGLKAG